MLDRLIVAVASEIETERTAATPREGLLREMEAAIAELRLARGVRLMLLNAYSIQPDGAGRRHRRAVHGHTATGWPRVGRRVA